MSQDIIQQVWERGKKQKQEVSMQEIEQAIKPSMQRQTFTFKLYIWIWLLIIFTTMILGGMNVAGYAANPAMLITQMVLTFLAILFGIYGIHLLNELSIIDRADESITSLLKRRLRFYHSKYEIWNLMMAAMIPVLSFAVTSYIDNQNGIYRINKPFLFVSVILIQFILGYAIVKLAQYPVIKEIKIFLSDLEEQVLEGTQKLSDMKIQWRRWGYILLFISTILLLLGIWQAIKFTV